MSILQCCRPIVLLLYIILYFANVTFAIADNTKVACDEDRQRITYFSGDAVYSEALIEGRLVALYFSGDGSEKTGRYGQAAAFAIQTATDSWMAQPSNTQRHDIGWSWQATKNLGINDRGSRHFVLQLKNEKFPMSVTIHTLLDGTAVMQRWVEVTNLDSKAFVLMGASSWTGQAWPWAIADGYDLGYQVDNGLGWFKWQKLKEGSTVIESNYGNGYDDPFFVLRNVADSEYLIAHLAWTANWKMQFDCDFQTTSDRAGVSFTIGPQSKDPLRVLKAGETVSCPKVHLGFIRGSFDEAVQAMHTHIRKSVLPKRPKDRAQLIQYSVPKDSPMSFYKGNDFNEQNLCKSIDVAAAIGAELFIIDHGWWQIYGNWEAPKDRFPNGIEAVADYARQKGLLFGLYFEVEGGRGDWRKSDIYQQHPEWFGPQDVLKLHQPEVAAYVENLLIKNIEQYDLDLYRHDFIPGYTNEWMSSPVEGFTENCYWRYHENYYAVWERIHKKYPDLILQMCTNGGAREDLDMMSRFHETYTVEDPDLSFPVSRLGTYNCSENQYRLPPMLPEISGKTVALPPECLVYGVPPGKTLKAALEAYHFPLPDFLGDGLPQGVYRNLKTHMMFTLTTPWVLVGVSPSLDHLSKEDFAYYRHYTDLYKNFIRPIQPMSKVYHHAPVSELGGVESSTWFAMEFIAPDKSKGWATIARLGNEGQSYLFRPRGLDGKANYKVTFDIAKKTIKMSGHDLATQGMLLDFESILSSECLLFEKVSN